MEPQAIPPSQISPIPPTPKTNNSLIFMMSILLIVTVAIAGLFYFQIQKLSKELSKYQTQASPTPTATIDPTLSWKTFSIDSFTIKLPLGWQQQKLAGDPIKFVNGKSALEIHQEKTLLTLQDYVIKNKTNITGLYGNEIGWQEEASTVNQLKSVRVTFQRPLANYVIYYFKNEPLSTAVAVAFSLDFKDNLNLVDQILSTFKFLESPASTPQYTCPANGYVNCMPGPDSGVKFECTSEAVNWYKENCPNFKDRAY